jgi:hypothetical protein
MTDHLLNYVRCQWCGGNAGSPSHRCTPEGEARQQSHVQAQIERMMGAPNADPATLTTAQLRGRLAECEEALRTTEDNLAAAEMKVALYADLIRSVGGTVEPSPDTPGAWRWWTDEDTWIAALTADEAELLREALG